MSLYGGALGLVATTALVWSVSGDYIKNTLKSEEEVIGELTGFIAEKSNKFCPSGTALQEKFIRSGLEFYAEKTRSNPARPLSGIQEFNTMAILGKTTFCVGRGSTDDPNAHEYIVEDVNEVAVAVATALPQALRNRGLGKLEHHYYVVIGQNASPAP